MVDTLLTNPIHMPMDGVENLRRKLMPARHPSEQSKRWTQMKFPTMKPSPQYVKEMEEKEKIYLNHLLRKRNEEDPKKLADDHWEFLLKVINLHNERLGNRYTIQQLEFYFKEGFIHGYKHGNTSHASPTCYEAT